MWTASTDHGAGIRSAGPAGTEFVLFSPPRTKGSRQAGAIKSVIRGRFSRFGLARPALCKSYASHLQSSSAASVLPFYPSARRPGVESSETILLRRLILRLINQISLLSSLAYSTNGPPTHLAPVCWRRDYMFRLNHHDRCVGTFRRTISCAIVEFQTQAGEGAGSSGLFSDADARLVSSHSRAISSVNTGASPLFVQYLSGQLQM
jgi:hypothetical protein